MARPTLAPFNNLEIKGHWNGNESSPVALQVSIEVQCIPHTKLQLLNLRPEYISLVSSMITRQTGGKPSIEDLSKSPVSKNVGVEAGGLGLDLGLGIDLQSPLTTILEESVSGSGSGSGSSRNAPSSSHSHSVYSTEPATDILSLSLSIPNTETGSSSRSSRAVSEQSKLSGLAPGSGPGSGLGDVVEEVYPDIKRLEELNSGGHMGKADVPQNLGKRSASDACLDFENEKRNISEPSGYQRQNPSLIPRARKDFGISQLDGPWDTDDAFEGFDPQTKIASDELLNSDTESVGLVTEPETMENGSPTPVRNSQVSADPSTAGPGSVGNGNPVKPRDSPDSIVEPECDGNPKLNTSVRDLQMSAEGSLMPTQPESNGSPKLETPVRESLVSSDGDLSTAKPESIDNGNGSPTPVRANSQVPADSTPKLPKLKIATTDRPRNEPKLDLVDGILVVSNPFRADFATYKITLITEVRLQKGRIGDWAHLRVPGLPRMKNAETGWFLFQIPEWVGLEFRTTSFGSHKFVEDCFLAELVQSGDLNIPLRLCPRSFYGTLGDFTVDQEIQSEHVMHKHSQKRMVVYTAICSLRLYKRCFFSERCSFYLWIDGGPEGDYHCVVDSSSASPAFLLLPSGERSVGVSCIHIVCSPRELGAFCVSWCVDCRCCEGLEWLPRVFSTQISRHTSLREVISQLSSGFVTKTILDPLDVTRVRVLQSAKVRQKQTKPKARYSLWVFCILAIGLFLTVFGVALAPPSELSWRDRLGYFLEWEDPRACPPPPSEPSWKDKLYLVATKTVPPSEELSWRDKLDYFLGWEGPHSSS